MRIEKLRDNWDIDIRLVHFPLHPDTPQDGKSLEELFAGRGVDLDDMYARMKANMDGEGLEYAQRTHTYNSRLAQELGKWADTQPGGDAIHDALYRAYFVDRKNIGDVDVLLDVAEAVGLDREAARAVIEQRSFSDAVDEDWQKSRNYGVTGVPTFVALPTGAQPTGVVGAQPYEVLEQLLESAGAKRK